MFKKLVSAARNIRDAHFDARMNRKLVGTDKFNNKYYQYYDNEGRETKRICEYKNKISEQDIDLNWDAWLRYHQKDPFTPEELNKLYENQLKWQENAHAYEKEDSDMMAQHRKEMSKKHLEENPHTGKEQGQGEAFQPGEWKPGVKKRKDDDM